MKRYFAKPGTWFKEGTECSRREEMWPACWLYDKNGVPHASATYTGIYIVGSPVEDRHPNYDNYWYNKGYKKGDEVEMSELCYDSEFIVLEGTPHFEPDEKGKRQ
tara:strand:+ start:222 stop:536 length:315 start_codon:yes stop_codon:yes gene_type:complete